MLMNEKERYSAPETEVLDFQLERVIATSAPNYEDGGLLN